jgi:hypothetical protein
MENMANMDIIVILIEVIDTGIGIKPECVGSLFRLFGRLNQEDQNINKNGVGLGLAISQSLVQSPNSFLPGKLGKGSKFYFPLFVHQYENSHIIQERNWDSLRQPCMFSNKLSIFNRKTRYSALNEEEIELKISQRRISIKILVVDDDQINLLVANSYLKSNDEFKFIISSTLNGYEAVINY